MRLLLVNDDGIKGEGLHALAAELKGVGQLYVVAPDSEQSGASMAVTLGNPVQVEKREFPGTKEAYAIGGTPVDCVKIAMGRLMPEKPDLLVSGINHGNNLGINVHYSGTVAAAIEGASQGLACIAVSVPRHGPADFSGAARFIRKIVLEMDKKPLPPGMILNVNFPLTGEQLPRGVKLTRQCPAGISESYKVEGEDEGKKLYYLRGKISCVGSGTQMDNSAVRAGYISVTPLTIDLTDSRGFGLCRSYGFEKMFRAPMSE